MSEQVLEAPKAEVVLALVHWPVVDKAGTTVVTNVTNFDIHDIARACRTYGVKRYFIVNRLQDQLGFVSRVLDHWRTGYGKNFNSTRSVALAPVQMAETVEEVVAKCGPDPLIVATSAKSGEGRKSFSDLRTEIWSPDRVRPIILLFGTGYGLHSSVLDKCHAVLEPIRGMPPEDYRHLSVRSAVSICLDRLLGKW